MTATLVPGDIVLERFSTDGIMRWAKRFVKEDFNDVAAAAYPAGFQTLWELGQITITAVTVYLKSTTSGAGLTWIIYLRFGPNAQSVVLKSFVTAASKRNVERVDCRIPLADELQSTTGSIVGIEDTTDPSVAHLADDCYMMVEGYVTPRSSSNPIITSVPLPVSLEGYRWPLKRAV